MAKKLKRRSQQAKIPAQIHVLDHLTDRIIHTLDNKAGRLFWDDEHLNTLQDESVYDFITRYNNSEALKGRNRLIIPSEGGEFYHELIIDETIKQGDTKEVYSTASYLDLQKAKVIAPRSFENTKLHIMANVALGGTEWALGRVENDGQRSIKLDEYTNPYRMLRRIASLFGMEIRFRIVTKNGRVIGRYVDFLQKRGEWRGKEVTIGKDLKGVIRKENTEDIISALVVVGPTFEDENGETQRIVTEVTDEEARKRWSRTGAHVWDYHEPETDNDNITEARLQTIGRTELNKRITAAVTYEADTVSIEDVFGLEHEKTRLGDTVRVKDTSYEPPLYMEARVFSIRRSIANLARKVYELGDFVELDETDIFDIQRRLEAKIASRVSRRRLEEYAEKKRVVSNEPPNDPDVIWEDPTQTPHVFNVYNGEAWVKATPTLPGEVGAYGKDEVDRKLESAEDALNEASRRYTQNFYMDEIEIDLQRARKYTDEEIRQRANEIRSDLYVSIDSAKTELSNNLSTLNNDLTKAINRKVETGDVNEAISGLVRTVDYVKDQQVQRSRFESNETKIEQSEKEISQQALRIEQNENDLSEARTSITQTANLLEQKAENSRVNQLAGTLEENQATIRTVSNAVDIRVTENRLQESIDAIEIGGKNRVKNSDFANGNTHWTSLGTIYEEESKKYIAQNYGWSTRQVAIPVVPGKTHTVSALVRNPTGSASAQFRASIRGYKGNTEWQKNVYAGSLSTDWRRESASFDVPEDVKEVQVYFLNADSNNTDIYIDMTEFQIEIGTKATDWKAAPEDIESKIEKNETFINTVSDEVSIQSRRLSEAQDEITEAQSELSVQADEIASKVESSDYQNKVDDIERNLSSKSQKYPISMNPTDDLVILLTKAQANGTQNYINGQIYGKRGNSSNSSAGKLDIVANANSSGDNLSGYMEVSDTQNDDWRLITCDYQGDTYIAVRRQGNIYRVWNQFCYFVGEIASTGEMLKVIDIEADKSAVSNIKDFDSRFAPSTPFTRANTRINQTADDVSIQTRRITEVGNDLTDARSEINALVGEIELKAAQTEVNDIEDRLSEAESSLRVLPGEIDAKVSIDDIITRINLSREGVRIDGDKNRITGETRIDNGVIENAMIRNLDGRKIIADSITATQMNIADLSAITANLGSVTAGELTAVDIHSSNFQMRGNGYRMDIADGRILTRDTSGSRERRALFDTATLYLFEVDSNGLPSRPDMSITPNRIRARPELVIEAERLVLDGGDVIELSNNVRIGSTGGILRLQRDTRRYVSVTPNHIDFYFAEGLSHRFSVTGSGHHNVHLGRGIVKGHIDSAEVRIRNEADNGHIPIYAGDFRTISTRESKTNINKYTADALEKVLSTPVYTYKKKNVDQQYEDVHDRYYIGLILEEAPRMIQKKSEAIDLYGMTSMLWKSVQQLTKRVEELEYESA